jgi:hypothetical protein
MADTTAMPAAAADQAATTTAASCRSWQKTGLNTALPLPFLLLLLLVKLHYFSALKEQ